MSDYGFVSVCYQSKNDPSMYSAREYTYKDGVGLLVGDLAVAPVGGGQSIAKVVRIGVREEEIAVHIRPLIKTIESLYVTENKEEGEKQT